MKQWEEDVWWFMLAAFFITVVVLLLNGCGTTCRWGPDPVGGWSKIERRCQ